MNSTHDVDRLREVFTAFDPVRGAENPAGSPGPEAGDALSHAPDRAPARWPRVMLVAAAVAATVVVPVAVFSSVNAAPSAARPALAGGPAASSSATGGATTSDQASSATISDGAASGPAAAVTQYQAMMADRDVIQRAEQVLIGRCMAAAGFEYTPVEQLPARWRQLTQPLSVQAASESGYASLTEPLTGPSAEANEKYVASLSPADQQRYSAAISGTAGDRVELTDAAGTTMTINTTGCTRQADRDLFGDAVKWAELSLSFSDIRSVSADDAALKHVTQQWSSCMEGRDYHFAGPDAAMQQALSEATPFNRLDANGNEVPEETAGADPDGARAIAVADATCRAQTGWDDAHRDAAQRALAAAFEAHESDVLAYQQMATAGVAKAHTVLGQ